MCAPASCAGASTCCCSSANRAPKRGGRTDGRIARVRASGASPTLDAERGLLFLPVGNPADSFYGADRKGTNLYANSVVALDALTGKLRWYYQTVHHDIWDYDLAAPPALVEVKRDGKTIPAVAQITKMGLLFILDRTTGKPVFGVEERAVPKSDVPGEEAWPTQPFPVKPPPLARMSLTAAELTTRTPEAHKFCAEWLARVRHEGAYTPFGIAPTLIMPGTMGGGNWGGVSYDPGLGYIFVNTSSLGGTGKMVAAPAGAPMPYRNEGGYTRFLDQDQFPCQQPPWGELTAVNANTGEIAWRVPLGSYDAVEAAGLKNAGAANMGGSIATAGGLVFIAATTDAKFRAFDSRTGKELWMTRIDATGDAVLMTYLRRAMGSAVRGDRGGRDESLPHDREHGGRDGGFIDRLRARRRRASGSRAAYDDERGAGGGVESRAAGGGWKAGGDAHVHDVSRDGGVHGDADESRGLGGGSRRDGGEGRGGDGGRDSRGGGVFGEDVWEVKRGVIVARVVDD